MAAGSAGGQMLLGISLEMNARGVVAGSNTAQQSLDQVENKAREVQKTVDQSANAMGSSLQQAMGFGAIGAAAIGVSKGIETKFVNPMIDQAKSFEVEMSQLQFVSKATGEELKKLQGVAIETGLKTQFSPQEAAQGLRVLRAAGLSTNEALSSLNATLDVATGSAGMLGLDSAAQSTAAGLLKFKHTGETAREIMDNFANSTRETNMQFHDLPILLNSIRVAPQLLKASSKEVFTLAGAMKNAGMSAAESGMAIMGFADNLMMNERMLERYLMKSKITYEQFSKLGVEDLTKGRGVMRVRALKELGVSIFDMAGKLRPAQDIIRDLLSNLERLTGESEKKFLMTVSTAFSRQAKNMLVSLKGMEKDGLKGVEAFDALLASVGASAGASREAAAAFENTQQGLEKFIQGTKETINILMGQTMLPILHDFHFGIRQVLNAFLEFVQKNPAFAKALGMLAVGAMLVTKGIGLAALAVAGFLTWSHFVAPALASMGGAAGMAARGFGILRGAMVRTMSVLKPMIGLFALMWLGAQIWKKIWDEKATGVWKNLQIWLTQIKSQWDAFSEGFMDGVGIFLDTMLELFQSIGEVASKAIDYIGSALEGLGLIEHSKDLEKVNEVWTRFGRIIGFLVSARIAMFGKEVITSTFAVFRLSRAVGTLAMTKLPALGGALRVLGSGLRLAAKGVWWLATSMLKGLWGGIQAVFWGLNKLTFNAIPRLLLTMKSWAVSIGSLIAKYTVLTVRSIGRLLLTLPKLAATTITTVIASLKAWAVAVGSVVAKYAILAVQSIGSFLARIPMLVASIWTVTSAWIAQAAAMLVALAPYILIGLAIAAVVAGIVWLALKIWEFRDVIWDALVTAGTAIKDFFVNLWDNISGFFTSIVDRAWNWGVGLWEAFKQGLISAWGGVKNWFWEKIQWIRDLLPGSNAKTGPLSDLTGTGHSLLNTVQKGAEEASPQFRTSLADSLTGANRVLGGQDIVRPTAAQQSVSKSVVVNFDKIEIHIAKATEEEADNFVRLLMEKVRDYMDNENEVQFA